MPARKNQDIPLHRAHTAHHPMSPCVNLVRRFASWTAVAKQLPVRPFLADLGTGTALILTVVPFDQVPIDFGFSSEASQLAGPRGALQGTGKHPGKCQAFQPFAKPLSV